MQATEVLFYCEKSGRFNLLPTNSETLIVGTDSGKIQKAFVFKENLILIIFATTAENKPLTTIAFIKTPKRFLELKFRLEQNKTIELDNLKARYIILEEYNEIVQVYHPSESTEAEKETEHSSRPKPEID